MRFATADLNRDGDVSETDLNIFLTNHEDLVDEAALAEGRARIEAFRRARAATRDAIEAEEEALRLARIEAHEKTPDVVFRTDAAIPHEPPTYDPELKVEDAFGGDPNPFSGRADTGFVGITSTGWAPPDPHMAAGPDHLVAMTNGAIAFFDKDGTKTFQDEIENSYGFWGSLGATGFVFDPEVIYDPFAGRFMAMACERTISSGSGDSYFLLAVSDDANPNGSWHKYRLNVTSLGGGGDIDSPNIAVDQEAVYLTADFFTGGQKYLIYILEKTPLLGGNPTGITRNLLITGAQSHGIPVIYGNSPAMYLIEHFESNTNTRVRLHAITDPWAFPSSCPGTSRCRPTRRPSYSRPRRAPPTRPTLSMPGSGAASIATARYGPPITRVRIACSPAGTRSTCKAGRPRDRLPSSSSPAMWISARTYGPSSTPSRWMPSGTPS